LSTIKVGMWYRLEYSRYTNSPTHVLVQKISEANTQEIPFQTRLKDGLVQVWFTYIQYSLYLNISGKLDLR
jgi:hypothetical protein